eukprot:s2379_g12.t3
MELLRRHDPEFARAAREGVVWKILSRHAAASDLGPDELDFLALKNKVSADVKGSNQFPRWKLAYCREAASQTDLKKMMSKDMLGSVREADAIMTEWRSIVTSIGDTAHMHEVHRALSYGDMSLAAYVMGISLTGEDLHMHEVHRALSYGDMSLAAYVMGISLTGEDLQKYKCKESLAHDVVVILQGIVQVPLASPWAAHQVKPPAAPAGYKCKESLAHDVVVILQGIVQVPLASPWAAHQVKPPAAPAGSPASQPAPRQSIMRELAADGSVKDSADLLKEAGFEAGQHVRRKADQEYGEILSVDKGRVRLKQAGGDVVRVSMDGFLAGEWSVFTPKPEPHVIEDVFQYFPTERAPSTRSKSCWQSFIWTCTSCLRSIPRIRICTSSVCC